MKNGEELPEDKLLLEKDEQPPSPASHPSMTSSTEEPASKRQRYEATAASHRDNIDRRLPFGTFALGTSIFRNRLHESESFENGHVSLSNLVLPEAEKALCTSFTSPSWGWLRDVFHGIEQVLVVSHGDDAPKVGEGKLEPVRMKIANVSDGEEQQGAMNDDSSSNSSSNWLSLRLKPHSGRFLHAKLLLFHSRKSGLRLVACGSNLMQEQWEGDRDTLWVQDFFHISEDDDAFSTTSSTIESGMTKSNGFEKKLRSFLDDLTKCQNSRDQTQVVDFLEDMFLGIDFEKASAHLVFSFPRPRGSKKDPGGWPSLAKAVKDATTECGNSSTSDRPSSSSSVVYAIAGSFGNVDPVFLQQMYQAMHGCAKKVANTTSWDDVETLRVRCLWPSRETALKINFHALVNGGRAIPMKHWKNEIPTNAKRRHFLDALPNPQPDAFEYHPVTHAKVLFKTGGGNSIVVVGSHNFSAAAWGIGGKSPNNIEASVVLVTSARALEAEWRDRLPCVLPHPSAESPSSYIPASAHPGIRKAYEEGDVNKAFALLKDWLRSDDVDEDSVDGNFVE